MAKIDSAHRFGGFTLLPQRRVLRRDGTEIEIGARALDLLIHLVAHAGEVVSKEALMRAAWGGRAVEPNNLTVQITWLRRTLMKPAADASDAATVERSGAVIRTVPGAGYLFAWPVEACEDALPAMFPHLPPPASAQAAPDMEIPASSEPITSFVGRQTELDELARLLRINRLVSVTGIGGVGKTRLVHRLAQASSASYLHGVVFVDLAPQTDAGRVADMLATAAGAGESTIPAEAALVALLRPRQMLLIIDNAEHLLDAVRALLQTLFARCPRVSALVTSRESLGIPGERVFRLQPLALPPRGHVMRADEALAYDAIRLFVDRATALLSDFTLDDEAAAAAVEICHRLDGIALAIEMAVPRLQVLTPTQLAARLQDRFQLLARVRNDVLPRQRTLRTMFDWSWELLSPAERRLLQRLAIFAAGATLASLEALQDIGASGGVASDGGASDGGAGEWTALEQLTALVEKSLVVVQRGETPRFRLLETTRQYALERLPPDLLQALHLRHALHVAAIFEQAEAEWPTTNGKIWIERYGAEADNLRAALSWAFGAKGDGELALRLVAGSASLWWELPGLPLREGRRWHELALERITPATPLSIQGKLWLHQSWKDLSFNDAENYVAAQTAIGLFRAAGDAMGLGAALCRAASSVLYREHQPSAATLLAEALHLLAPQPRSKYLALCLVRQADLLAQQSALADALGAYDEALLLIRALDYGYGLMICGGNRAFRLSEAGQIDAALAQLRGLRRLLHPGLQEPILSQLAMHLALRGDAAEAAEAASASLSRVAVTGVLSPHIRALEALALLRVAAGDAAMAARFLGSALRLHPATRPRMGARREIFRRVNNALDLMLPCNHRVALIEEGKAWTEEDISDAANHAMATVPNEAGITLAGSSRTRRRPGNGALAIRS